MADPGRRLKDKVQTTEIIVVAQGESGWPEGPGTSWRPRASGDLNADTRWMELLEMMRRRRWTLWDGN